MKTITVEIEDETFEWMTEYAREHHITLGQLIDNMAQREVIDRSAMKIMSRAADGLKNARK